jgi:FKBP-type peptidyl-prolyl cis-trans isomerase FkpA
MPVFSLVLSCGRQQLRAQRKPRSSEPMTRAAVVLSTLFALSCITPAELDDRWEDPDEIEFVASLDIDLTQLCASAGQLACWQRTASGLYWKDLTLGSGAAAAAGDSVHVRHTGWLPDGTMFESSHDLTTQPLKFRLGVGLALKGWDEGLVGMQVGGKRKLVIRPSLAYGRAGKGPIPPLATLVFDVDLIWLRRNLVAQLVE